MHYESQDKNDQESIGTGTLLTNKKELLTLYEIGSEKGNRRGDRSGRLSTGRPYNGVPKELKEFEGIRYALTSNGGRIVEIGTGEALKRNPDSTAAERKRSFIFLRITNTIPEMSLPWTKLSERSGSFRN